jgi:hypothetical protein
LIGGFGCQVVLKGRENFISFHVITNVLRI